MALIQMDFMASTIQRWTSAEIVLPDDVKVGEKLSTVVLLHGYSGNHKDWTTYSNVVRYAGALNEKLADKGKKRMALIMPDGDNSYYLNFPERTENYEDYIADELIQLMRNTFPLSDQREDTFIIGLSMGGGGAIRMGLRRGDVFCRAAGLSAGLTVAKEAEEVGHDCDMYGAFEKVSAQKKEMAELYFNIGTEDPLLQVNRDFHAFLLEKGVDHHYEENPGTHNWDYWDEHVKKALAFAAGEV